MLVKVQLGEKEYIYLNLAQTIIVHFSKEDFTIYIKSVCSTATYHFENESFIQMRKTLLMNIPFILWKRRMILRNIDSM